MGWIHVKKQGIGTCSGKSLRDTRNCVTVLKTEGTLKSIMITPILIHIFERVLLLFARFHCPTWIFPQPSACFSDYFYGSRAAPGAQCPSRDYLALQEGVPVKGEELGLFHAGRTMLTLRASCSSGFARSLDPS